MLPKNWLFSAVLLVLALGGVIFVQSQLMSAGEKTPVVDNSPKPMKVNWCDGEVTAIEMPGQIKVSKTGGRWTVSGRELGQMTAWLNQYCTLDLGQTYPVSRPGLLNPFLRIEYAGGKKAKSFQIDPEGSFAWDGRLFRSNAFNQAIKELRHLVSN